MSWAKILLTLLGSLLLWVAGTIVFDAVHLLLHLLLRSRSRALHALSRGSDLVSRELHRASSVAGSANMRSTMRSRRRSAADLRMLATRTPLPVGAPKARR